MLWVTTNSKLFGGSVKTSKKKREFGRASLYKKKNSLLTKNFFRKKNIKVWMSHQDAVIKLPKKFKAIASTSQSKFTIIENTSDKLFGVQFHPEVTHTENGIKIMEKNC